MKNNDYIWLFGRTTSNLRLINTCKNAKGERCIATRGETIFAIQEQKSFLGIKYWRTIHTSTDYNHIVDFYKCIIAGHPDFFTKEI